MMIEVALKIGAITSAGLLAAGQMDPVAVGDKLGHSSAAAVLGFVCVSCVVALVAVYRDKAREQERSRKAHDEHTQKLYKLIETNTATNQRLADQAEQQANILVEVKDAIIACQIRSDSYMPRDGGK